MPEIVLLKVFVVLLVYREAVGYRLEGKLLLIFKITEQLWL